MQSSEVILLAEDHPQTAIILGKAALERGWRLLRAATADAAADILAGSRASCVILDARLPGDVLRLCRSLHRSGGEGGAASVVLLVPPRFDADRLALLRPLCDAVVRKPFHVGDLITCVEALLEARGPKPYPESGGQTGGGNAIRDGGPAELASLAGSTLAGCRLDDILGTGASGAVYLGRHLMLDIPVAVKILPLPSAGWREEDVQRFERGARAAARVAHPNVVQVLHAGREGNVCFLVQRFVEGRTLKSHMDDDGPLDPPLAWRVLREIGAGLAAVHDQGIVHRDVKPANIIVTASGKPLLTDFGFARPVGVGDISSESALLGTPYYMSPEQCEGRPLDGRADLYALGATVYHALAGRPPIEGATPIDVVRGHLKDPPRDLLLARPDLDPAPCALVMRLMAKDPADRFSSAAALMGALDEISPLP